MRIELFKTRKQLLLRVPTFRTRYYFRIVGDNGETIAQSEGYTQRHNAVEVLNKYFPAAKVVEVSK
jgi:uncharacterized protein YegP (UPF0339 family)